MVTVASTTFGETTGQLRSAGTTILNPAGQGTVYFSPGSANERWEVTYVGVSTNQPQATTITPIATLALNSNDTATMSQANARGSSWSGNQDAFTGLVHVGACDFLSVLFYPPPGATPAQITQLAGVVASVVLTGTRYTKRRLASG